MKTISEYLEDDLIKWSNKPYITYMNKTYTFAEFIGDVKALAKELLTHYKQGSTFAVYSENSYAWTVIDIAVQGYAGICVPIDKEWTVHDLTNTFNFIQIDVCFYSSAMSEKVSEITDKFPKTDFICIDSELGLLIEKGKIIDDSVLRSRDNVNETAKIIFSSGTTSVPKAIPLTQANLINNWDTLYKRTPMTEKDISCIFLPLNHVYSGVANFLYSIISGMRLYLCDDIKKHVNDIIKVRPTVVCTVPLLLKKMYQAMTSELLEALQGIRFLYCGGSFTEPEIKKWFRDNNINLLEAYGTTETSSVIALDLLGEPELSSNGTVFENLDVKIIDADENGFGEILVKGGSRTEGYLNCPYNERYFDESGYFHTGDIGKLDEKRRLYLRGRKKRMLETSDGKNVFADEIEELILETGLINKVKVYLEEYKIAAQVYSNADESEIRAAVEKINEKLPHFKKIRHLHIKRDDLGSRLK